MSLIERKKAQWAQEKAEMEELCNPWGLPTPAYSLRRGGFGSTLEIRDTCPATAQQNLKPPRQRSPSLPTKVTRGEDAGGETSGYASDAAPQSSPELWHSHKHHNPVQSRVDVTAFKAHDQVKAPTVTAWQYAESETHNEKSAAAVERETSGQRGRGRERLMSAESQELRARWGDRGLAAGRLWEPQDSQAALPQMQIKGTPAWVARSLNMINDMDSQILVMDQNGNHSANSIAGLENNTERGTFLLGQNVPLEPNIKAERECRRTKALELQAAIIQQLEDREKQKQQERERQLKEERDEDERFRRQRELENERLQEEKRILDEKKERERKRAEALKLALEKAELQAKLEKENKKLKKLQENFDEISLFSELDLNPQNRTHGEVKSPETQSTSSKYFMDNNTTACNTQTMQTYPDNNKMVTSEYNTASNRRNSTSSTLSKQSNINDQRFKSSSALNEPTQQNSQQYSIPMNQPVAAVMESPMSMVHVPLLPEYYTPVHYPSNGVQMAIIVPHTNGVYQCYHPPATGSLQAVYTTQLPYHTHHNLSSIPTEQSNRECHCSKEDNNKQSLIPIKYSRDASTQTEPVSSISENYHKMKHDLEQNISDEKLNKISSKKDKKYIVEEKVKDLEGRPKWGVNKPNMQYKKQSEKDILYSQKRKHRQRKRTQEKNYTSHSSEDNRSPSPNPASSNIVSDHFPKARQDKPRISLSENHWRKKSSQLKANEPNNASVERIKISPLEYDKSGVVHVSNETVDPTKTPKKSFPELPERSGLTLSQKFMNDKYGNPKLWSEKVQNNDVASSEYRNFSKTHNTNDNKHKNNNDVDSQRLFDRAKQNLESNQPMILNQLKSLRDSLKKQQQMWGKYNDCRTYSPKDVDYEME